MADQLVRAEHVRVGDRLYDHRHADWIQRWPAVVRIEPISAGRLSITTTNRLFVATPTELLLRKEL
jgi:hypothetical protein